MSYSLVAEITEDDASSAYGNIGDTNMDRKQKRDAKNARHRRNERRREVLRILRRAPAMTRLLGAAEDIARQIRSW
jgi:hypothetical protein